MRSRQAKDRHDGIPDELLEGPTVLLNDTLGVGVVAAHQGANIFGVEALAQFCRASHIGKEDGHELSLFWHERTSTATMAGKANLTLDYGYKRFAFYYEGEQNLFQLTCSFLRF